MLLEWSLAEVKSLFDDPPRSAYDGICDEIEINLTGQSLKLFRFLKKRRGLAEFNTLRERDSFWRKNPPEDGAIETALKRMRTDLNELNAPFDLHVFQSETLDKLTRLEFLGGTTK